MSQSLWVAGLAVAALIVLLSFRASRRRRLAAKAPRAPHFRLTAHATQRMGERHVTLEQVRSVLAAPGRFVPDTTENSVRLEKHLGDRVVIVWVAAPWPSTEEIVVKSTAWEYATSLSIPVERIGYLIGRGGATIGRLRAETGVRIHVDNDGTVRVAGESQQAVALARRRVTELVGASA